MNYDIVSQIIVVLFFLAYVAFLAALAWWALAARLRAALKTLGLVSPQARRTVRFRMMQLKRGELKLRSETRNDYHAPCSGRN